MDTISVSSGAVISGSVSVISFLSSLVVVLFLRNLNQTVKTINTNVDLKFKNLEDSLKASDILNSSINSNSKSMVEDIAKDQADLLIEVRAKDREYREEHRLVNKKIDEGFAATHKRIDSIKGDYTTKEDFREHKKEVFFAIQTPHHIQS